MEFSGVLINPVNAIAYGGENSKRCSNGVHAWNTPRKLLKTWSGRRDSNPRRPAWENDSKLKTQNIVFMESSFWRLRIPSFHSELPGDA
jgi:hypothetical protein